MVGGGIAKRKYDTLEFKKSVNKKRGWGWSLEKEMGDFALKIVYIFTVIWHCFYIQKFEELLDPQSHISKSYKCS